MSSPRLLSLITALMLSLPAFAGGAAPAVQKTVPHYAAIGTALASDSTVGISEHAKAMLASFPDSSSGDHQGHPLAAGAQKALHVLATKDTSLDAARESYKALSVVYVKMAQDNYASADNSKTWTVMSCPMAKAQWIQEQGTVSNPYLGTEMPTCGQQVSKLGGMPMKMDGKQGHDMGHMH